MVMVLPANIQDRDGAKQLLTAFFSQKTCRRVKHIWADGGYAGVLLDWSRRTGRCTIEIVKRSDLHTFKVLPRCWVVERTLGCFGRYRRLSRDYERQAHTGETMVYLARIRLMLARLGRPSNAFSNRLLHRAKPTLAGALARAPGAGSIAPLH